MNRILKIFIIDNVVFAILALFYAFLISHNDGWVLVDTFTVCGFCLILFSGLCFISNAGGFDFLAYACHKLITRFTNRENVEKYGRNYYEYHVIKENGRSSLPIWPTIVTGLFYIAIGLVIYFIQIS